MIIDVKYPFYYFTGQREHVVIRFVCNQSVPLGEPVFKSYQDLTLTLEFSTSLACAPKVHVCTSLTTRMVFAGLDNIFN